MHQLVFEPHSESFAQNPYEAYAALRRRDAPFFFEGANAWLLSRYKDVEQAAKHPVLCRSLEAFMPSEEIAEQKRKVNWHDMPNHSRFVQFSLLDSDGDIHFRLRNIVLREFSRKFVAQQRAMIQRYVDVLLEKLLEQRDIDFIADLAAHVPGHIIGHVLGVPDEDCPQLRLW
ncbi:MAG: cytochrome P450, partial [Pseudomonadota bacterium]